MSVTKILLCDWQLKFIHSQFPLPMALNSVLLKCQTDLKFVYLLTDRHVPFLLIKSKNYILLKIIFKFEHLTINKYLCNTTTRCTFLPVEMQWDLDASYDWLPKLKCLGTHESLYLKVPVIRLRSFL
jgi:hypothetical protein